MAIHYCTTCSVCGYPCPICGTCRCLRNENARLKRELARRTWDNMSPGPIMPPEPAEPPKSYIEKRAYLLWEEADCPGDRDLEFWFQAERECRSVMVYFDGGLRYGC